MGPAGQRPAFPIFDTYDMPGYRSAPRTHMVWPCNWLQVTENAMDPVHFLFLHAISGNIGFTEEFKEVGEIDFMETPIGMVYIDTRRFGYKVWVRVTDYTYPAIHQGCDLGGDIDNRDLNGPTITTWTVPIDDTHTMRIGFSRAREGEELSRGGGFGQSLDRPYEERQRTPGDYDAQVSQRPIEVHALEHLATSDRGVIMLRNMTRRGIRAVHKGEDHHRAVNGEGKAVPTFAVERVLDIPPAPTPEEDRQLLRDAGRKVVSDRINSSAQRGDWALWDTGRSRLASTFVQGKSPRMTQGRLLPLSNKPQEPLAVFELAPSATFRWLRGAKRLLGSISSQRR